ncbi:MAG: MFS transporter [Chloroflexi bacterium]|nr:MFS transporter [Chloroflexota bacterium]
MEQSIKARSVNPLSWGVVLVYWVVFVSFFDNHSLLPLLSPYAKSLGASIEMIGVIVGAYSAVNLLGNLGTGYWIDRIGRKTPMVVGLFIVAAILGLYPLARDPNQLLALRVAHGFGAALVSPASLALIDDRARPGQRGKAMAFYGASIGLTTLLAPPLSGMLRDRLGYASVFVMLAALIFVSALLTLFFVSEARQPRDHARFQWRVLMNRRLSVSYTSAFALLFALGLLIVFLPLMASGVGLSSAQTGMLFASFAVAAILMMALPVGRISDRVGRQAPIILGLALIVVALALMPVFGDATALYAWMFLYGIGFGVLFPAMTALIGDELPADARGMGAGMFTAVFSLGATAGTLATGLLVGIQQLVGLHPFQTAAALILFAMAWAWLALTPRRE